MSEPAGEGRFPPVEQQPGVAALEIPVPTAVEMRALGCWLAGLCRRGDVLVLAGPLGAGKTVLVQGLAAGLGVRAPVTSPTFVIAREHHDGRLPLLHVDAYRLGGLDEVEDLDLDVERSVTVVEWGEGLAEALADGSLLVRIERATGDVAGEQRTVRLEAFGESWRARLAAVRVLGPAGVLPLADGRLLMIPGD